MLLHTHYFIQIVLSDLKNAGGVKFRSISLSTELNKTLGASIIQRSTACTQQGTQPLPFSLVSPNAFQRCCVLLLHS